MVSLVVSLVVFVVELVVVVLVNQAKIRNIRKTSSFSGKVYTIEC